MSSYDTILKIDADIEIKENFFVSNKLGKEEYLAGNWRNRPLDQVQANDFFFIKRKHLSQVNGFNEFITTIGWNYEDLYDRLNTLGLCRKDFTSELVHYYIPDGSRQPICKKEHCGKLRSALEHALINPNFFIQKNRIICEKIKTWSRESRLAQFHQIKSQGNAPVFRRAPAFRNSIPRALSCVAETEALKIVVHNLWGLNFWNENDAQVRRLLYKYSKLN
jgi:hypothetical protein